MLYLYFIRHAESTGNVKNHLVGGQSNHLELTPRGENQARSLGQRLAREGMKFDRIYSSTAVRTQQTARLVGEAAGFKLDQVQLDAKLLELSQGNWEGQERAIVYTPEIRSQIIKDPLNFTAPGGESQADVAQRMAHFVHGLEDAYVADKTIRVAAFSHGFAIKTIASHLASADPFFTRQIITHNTSLTVLQYNGKRWLLERLNDFQHIIGTEFIDHYG